MKWKSSHNVAQNATSVLPKLAHKYFETGRKTVASNRSPKELHRFRIATKRFRYALELFRPVYGPTLDRRLKNLRQLQDTLGKISDFETIRKVLKDDDALNMSLRHSLDKKSKEFRRQWKAFDSGGQLKQWKAYLGRQRAQPRATKTSRRGSR